METNSFDFRSDTLSLTLSELNDEEYHLPAVDETPTLESILNEDESSLLSEDELAQLLPIQVRNNFEESEDNLSVGSFGLYRSNQSLSPALSISQYKYDPGNILRHSTMKTISAQLRSASERINAGHPSVMCVSTIIAIGTSYGLVLVFDAMQTLRWCHEMDIEQSSVSALNFNGDCTRLLAGYACGTILMFDVTDGKVLRTMNDVHTPSTAVLHVKFTDVPTLALCSDSGGSVFELNFKRMLGVRGVDSKCIFSGSRGEVCCIEPLLLHHLNSHPLRGSVLVAMATLTKLIVVSIRPVMKVLLTHTVKADPCSLPFLSWQFVVIQLSENSRIMDPVLAFARDRSIYFYQVNINKNNKLRCTALQKLDLDYSLLTCNWLNTRTIAALDTKEQLHLVDVRTKQELEKIDLSTVGLVYNSSHFKGLSTGGNVSKAMALAGERACYNTVQSYGNQVLFLGLKSCHVVSIRSWIERLDSLVDKGRFECALRLGIEFLEERGKIILGLRGPHHQRYNLVKNKVIDILVTYIDLVLNGGTTTVPITSSINTIINMALVLDQKQLLYQRMWEGFEYNDDTICRDIFLLGLSSVICEEKLNDIPPIIMQQLVAHLADMQMHKELELSILNVNIECLDIQQALQLSRQHSMHCALISIWNRAMRDYISPLQELLPRLNLAMISGRNHYARDLGNKLLVYISCCFGGRGYPTGDIDESLVEGVRNQVFQCLCNQHSVNAEDDEEIYPYLRILLKFDTKEFLNVLAMAFNDDKFSPQLKQRIVDILILVISQSTTFKVSEIGWIFTFLCLQSSAEKSRKINIDPAMYDKVINMLVNDKDLNTHEERQQAFLDLMLADDFQHFQVDQLLTMARNAEFYRVCSEIHSQKGEYGQVLRCYLLDPHRKLQVFDYLEHTSNKKELHANVMENFDNLLEINSEKTGFIFGKYYQDDIPNVIHQIKSKQQYYFLKGAMFCTELDSSLITLFMQLMCQYCEEIEILRFVQTHKNLQLEPALKAARERKLSRVMAILLERRGDYQAAFDILFDRLKESISKSIDIEDATEELVSLVHRGSSVLESKTTWLPLLQCLSTLNSRELLRRVLGSADLNLATELHLLLQHNSGTLGDYRNLITGLFDKCAYEHSMLKSVSKAVYSDLHNQLASTLAAAKKGVSSPDYCTSCRHSFKNQLLLFRCGHGYHVECAEALDTKCSQCSSTS
ncbi:vacuolar protein sorting-associated protein 8 homolog isoform X2 [Planococcus citri]|uniref:vacuolar protein sorting-associated protein 8 homolog isoform X2 n=1 Tax=Planococcus citri TaxID=170843 RepID=UPI0031F7D01E